MLYHSHTVYSIATAIFPPQEPYSLLLFGLAEFHLETSPLNYFASLVMLYDG